MHTALQLRICTCYTHSIKVNNIVNNNMAKVIAMSVSLSTIIINSWDQTEILWFCKILHL